jgi:hypothetical protein
MFCVIFYFVNSRRKLNLIKKVWTGPFMRDLFPNMLKISTNFKQISRLKNAYNSYWSKSGFSSKNNLPNNLIFRALFRICLHCIILTYKISGMSSGPPDEEERRRLFEYFIVAGLNDAQEAEELVPLIHECGNKVADQVAPITDM